MGAPGQQAIDEKMVSQLSTFIKNGDKHGIFATPGTKALRGEVVAWLPKMEAALDPAAVSEKHKAKIAPQLAVFDRTHDLVASLSLLFQGWGRAKENEVAIEAVTGPLLVGEDEQQDEKKLEAWQPIFMRMFGANALPPQLHNDAVKKQLAAHLAAREALPGTTDGQVFRAAQNNMVTLRKLGLGYWEQMHDLLDGEFGRGKKGFASKSEFGYERRLRGGGASRKKRVGEQPPAGAGAADAGEGASTATDAKKTNSNGAQQENAISGSSA